jgi:hypothetical protein
MCRHPAQETADDAPDAAATRKTRHDRPEHDAAKGADDKWDILFHGFPP